jgi:oxygen-independent coproporphyrinogen-3 oxidase
MNPEHLSFYGLGIEDGTPMQRWITSGQLPPPDSDLAAEMYEWASVRLAVEGYEQYEISNWAKPGLTCRHNVHYWRNLPYLGFGAGAHGYAAQTRYVNVLRPADYIERIEAQPAPLRFPLSAAADEIDTINQRDSMVEMMLMSLRLTQEGLPLDTFFTRYGHDLWSVYGAELDHLIGYGLLELTSDARVRLTERGRLLGNYVFEAFV